MPGLKVKSRNHSRVTTVLDQPVPDGQLKQDVMEVLRTYLGCDYYLRFWLTLPTRLLPRPRLGDAGLFNGYSMMLGLREDNLDEVPESTRIRVGRLREEM